MLKTTITTLMTFVLLTGVAAAEIPCDRLVVKVWFDDLQQLRDVASWNEPWEVHPDKGWMLLEIGFGEQARLHDLGLRIEIDHELTNRICTPLRRLPGQTSGIPGYPCYRSVEETFATAEQLAADYPDLVDWIDVGDSWEKTSSGEGYDMMVLKLTNKLYAGTPAGPQLGKPVFFVTSSIHAREYTPAELMTRFAEYLLSQYGSDADATWLLDEHEIHLMLHTNPDGRKQAETGLSWRKNTNEAYCGATSSSRGADLNRNFEFEWACCEGSSNSECDPTFHGPFAASEPETQTVQNYIRAVFPDQRGDGLDTAAPDEATGIYMDIHSYSELVLWPWSFAAPDPGNLTQLNTLGRKLAFFNGYEPAHHIWYDVDGGSIDFAYGDVGVAAFVFELGTSFFQDCNTFVDSILPDNLEALLYAAKVARRPYLIPSGPELLELALDSSSMVAPGTVVTMTAVADDSRFNQSNGAEPSQSVAAAHCSVDQPPWHTQQPVFQAMAAVDGAFDSAVESLSINIDTSGWADGRHMLYCQAQDADGNWGPVSAAFVWILDPENAPVIKGTVTTNAGSLPVAAAVHIGGLVDLRTDPADGSFSTLMPEGTYMVTVDPDAADLIGQTLQSVAAVSGATTVVNIRLNAFDTVFEDGGESGSQGWTVQSPWALTTEMASSPTHSWSDSPNGEYDDDVDSSLTSPVFDLVAASVVRLDFSHRWSFEEGYDYGYLEVSTDGGSTWATVRSWNGDDPGDWVDESVVLGDLEGSNQARIRFRVETDYSVTRDGWHLDDITLLAGSGDSSVIFSSGFETGNLAGWSESLQ